jgi:hypothetical protein
MNPLGQMLGMTFDHLACYFKSYCTFLEALRPSHKFSIVYLTNCAEGLRRDDACLRTSEKIFTKKSTID